MSEANTPINPYVNAIRTAVYGKDVRSAIADGIELCYNDITDAADTAHEALDDLDADLDSIALVQDEQPDNEYNKVWLKRTPGEEVTVPTQAEFEALEDRVAALEEALAGVISAYNSLDARVRALEGAEG